MSFQKVTKNNNERAEALRRYLCSRVRYTDVEATMKCLLFDKKAQAFLQEGGEFDSTKLTLRIRRCCARGLVATSNISLNKAAAILGGPSEKIAGIAKKSCVEYGMPIITFRRGYVLDGLNRWIHTCVVNPEADMLCLDFDNDSTIIPIMRELHKYASKGDSSVSLFGGHLEEDGIAKHVEGIISDDVVEYVLSQHLTDDYDEPIDTREKVVTMYADRLLSLYANNYPEDYSF